MAHSSGTRLGLAASLPLLLAFAGCSIMAPIPPAGSKPTAQDLRLFTPQKDDHKASDCSWEAGATDCFFAGMGSAMNQVDERRRVYLEYAEGTTSSKAAFNAALAPAGAVVLYRRLADGHSLLAPSLLASGLYGLVNSGIADREQFYLSAARELQCVQLRHAAWLYRRADIVGPALESDRAGIEWLESHRSGDAYSWRSGRMPAPPSWQSSRKSADVAAIREGLPLDTLIGALERAQQSYGQQRVMVIGALSYPKPKATSGDAIDRARGRGGSVAAPKDQRAELMQLSGERLAIAQQTLGELRRLRAQIAQAAWRLLQEANDAERETRARLAAAQAGPRDPFAVARELRDRLPAPVLAGAQAGANPTRMDPMFPPALSAGLSAESLQDLQMLSAHAGLELANAWAQGQNFLDRHEQRRAQGDADVRTLGCLERLPAVPRSVAPAASAPSTGASATPLAPR